MKKIGSKALFFLALFFPFMMAVAATKVEVQAQVDRDQMGIGDSFTLNIVVRANEDFELEVPPVPNIPGLELLNSWAGGKQESSQATFINGKAEFSKTVIQDFNYQFSPQKEGTFSIPIIDVRVNGQTFKTNPIKIEVDESLRNASRAKRGRVPGRPQYGDEEPNPFGNSPDPEDLFNQLLQQRQQLLQQLQGGGNPFGGRQFGAPGNPGEIPSFKFDVNTNEAFFIQVDADKTEVYEGEQVTVNWYIYTRGQLESLDRVKFPDLKGFWKEIIEEVPSLQFSPVIVNGLNYHRALLASHALFPIKPGTAVIDEFKIKGKVRLPTQFGYGQSREWTKVSRRTPIKVLPLPMEGKTTSFSGAVGQYRIQVKTDGTSFPAHQPFSVKVRFEGIGNAKMIELPPIAWPDGVEVFDTKSESKFFKDGQSFKEFEILLIPRKEGPLKIPSMSFSYFDPAQKKYVTEQTQELNLQITPGNPGAANSVTTTPANTPTTVVTEVYKPQPILELPQSSFALTANRALVYAALAAMIFFGFAIQFIWQLRGLHKEPEFQQLVEAKLKLIEHAQIKKDNKKTGSEALNLIYLLAASLAGQRRADQEWTQLIKEIPIKAQNQFLNRLTNLFDYFQLLGFSPENVVQQLTTSTPVEKQISDLKQLTKEISEKAKTEEIS